MPDGRMLPHAHPSLRFAAVVTATLTTVGLGLATAVPATAAPDTNPIEAVQARVDRLSQQAEAAEERHDKAQLSLTGARNRLGKVRAGIQRHRQIVETMRTQVATTVVNEFGDGYTSGAGASTPAPQLSEDSKALLTNVTVVSEDTGERGDAMAASSGRLQVLNQSRAAMRTQIATMTKVEQAMRKREQNVDSRAATAGATLAGLQEKAAAERQQAAAKRLEATGGPVLAYAKAQVGKAYVWGATGPSSFDCSGLTMAAWAQSGVSLPHNSTAQYNSGRRVSESELQPGDLVFYYSPISHVGLYVGDGQVVNALNPGSGVQISGLHDMPYSGAVRPG